MVRFLSFLVLLAGFSAAVHSFAAGEGAVSQPVIQDQHTSLDPVEAAASPPGAQVLQPCISPGGEEDNQHCSGKVLVKPTPPVVFPVGAYAPRSAREADAPVTAALAVDLRPPKRAV